MKSSESSFLSINKKSKYLTYFLALILVVFTSVSSVEALSITAEQLFPEPESVSSTFGSASIVWNSLTFSGIDIALVKTISTSSVNFIPDARADDFDQKFGVNTFENTSAEFQVSGGSGSASTTDTTVSSKIAAVARQSNPSMPATSGTAYSGRQAFFIAGQTGELTVEANYAIQQEASTEDNYRSIAKTSVTLTLSACEDFDGDIRFFCNSLRNSDQDVASFKNSIVGNDSIFLSESGTLRIALPFDAGQEGVFASRAGHYVFSAATPIPEPSVILLTIAGLIGLSVYRSKRGIL